MFISIPTEDAVIRDWTDKALVLDVENSLGETFHFEIEPDESLKKKTKESDEATSEKKSKTVVTLYIK